MRTLRNLLCLAALANADVDLPTGWVDLPPIPRGMPVGVSGDGPAVIAWSAGGGASAFTQTKTGWIQVEKAPWVEGVVARGKLVGFRSSEGFHYRFAGDDTLRRVATSLGVHIHTDGQRFVASGPAGKDRGVLYLSVDSTAKEITGVSRIDPVKWVHWRRLSVPSPFSADRPIQGWISGGTILASDGSRTWLSRDTGGRFGLLPIAGLEEADAMGDTIVGKAVSQGVFYISRDGGKSWDSTPAADKIRPEGIRFRGGDLWGSLGSSQTGRLPQLVRSTDLGRTWKESLAEFLPERGVASDGLRIWAFSRGGLKVLDPGGKAEWSDADGRLPEGSIVRFRAFRGGWLALQKEDRSERRGMGRLWKLEGSLWSLVREDVYDVQTSGFGQAAKVHVVVPADLSLKPTTAYALETSLDLDKWQLDAEVAVASPVLGQTTRFELLVAERTGIASREVGGQWRRTPLWPDALGQVSFVSAVDSEFVWGMESKGLFRQFKGAIDLGEQGQVRDFVPVRTTWSMVATDSMIGTLDALTPPLKRVLGGGAGAGVAENGDSVLCWSGWGGLVSQAQKGRIFTDPPKGRRVTFAASNTEVGAIALRPLPVDRTLHVADEHGNLWLWQRGISGVRAPLAAKPGVELLARPQGLAVRLASAGHVEVELFDLTGRSQGVALSGMRASGDHVVRVSQTGNVLIAKLRIDGVDAGSMRWMPMSR